MSVKYYLNKDKFVLPVKVLPSVLKYFPPYVFDFYIFTMKEDQVFQVGWITVFGFFCLENARLSHSISQIKNLHSKPFSWV